MDQNNSRRIFISNTGEFKREYWDSREGESERERERTGRSRKIRNKLELGKRIETVMERKTNARKI